MLYIILGNHCYHLKIQLLKLLGLFVHGVKTVFTWWQNWNCMVLKQNYNVPKTSCMVLKQSCKLQKQSFIMLKCSCMVPKQRFMMPYLHFAFYVSLSSPTWNSKFGTVKLWFWCHRSISLTLKFAFM